MAQEARHLQPRIIDLDPANDALLSAVVNELMHPNNESHIAYCLYSRQVARFVRNGVETERLTPTLPESSRWSLEPEAGGALEALQAQDSPERPLEPREVRVAVDAAGLDFRDVLGSLGLVDSGLLGRVLCILVIEIGAEVTSASVGDRAVALGFGTLSYEAIMH